MSEVWWAEAVIDRAPVVPIGFVAGAAPKGLLHTTEGSTYAGARARYASTGYWPHFTLAMEAGKFRARQHLPIDQAARALRHQSGRVETNRAHVIQAELVGFATASPSWPHAYLDGIARWMRWVEQEAGVQRQALRFLAYPASAGLNNGIRLAPAPWLAWNGWCGHQHVPGNDHGDPGAIDMGYLLHEDEEDDMGFTPEQAEKVANALDTIKNYVDAYTPRITAALEAIAAQGSAAGGGEDADPAH